MNKPGRGPYRKRSPLERFREQFTVAKSGCWLWRVPSHHFGYGRIWFMGSQKLAHRVSWELHRGPVPDGSLVLHQCDVPACVNPEHLFLGTPADNVHDKCSKGRWRIKPPSTHCKDGHEFTPENTYLKPPFGRRACKECKRIRKFNARCRTRLNQGETKSCDLLP